MNIKSFFFSAFLIFLLLDLFSQETNSGERYTAPDYFKKEEIDYKINVKYGEAKNWKGEYNELTVNIYFPKRTIDKLKNRPFIVLAHGGGFHREGENGNKNQLNDLCFSLAKRGFVTATIDYRVGWEDEDNDIYRKGKINPTAVYAVYRGYQDGRAAMRYFVENAEHYGIDTNAIFMGGRSAGGDISMATAFLSQQDIDVSYKGIVPDGFTKKFGSVDSSSNSIYSTYKIAGIISMWAPLADTSFISKEEAQSIAVVLFHGTDDSIVPYTVFSVPEYPYTRFGSYCIAKRYKHLGGCYQLNTKIGGKHSEDFEDNFLAEKISGFVLNVLTKNCGQEECSTELSGKKISKKVIASSAVAIVFLTLVFFMSRKRKIKNHGR